MACSEAGVQPTCPRSFASKRPFFALRGPGASPAWRGAASAASSGPAALVEVPYDGAAQRWTSCSISCSMPRQRESAKPTTTNTIASNTQRGGELSHGVL